MTNTSLFSSTAVLGLVAGCALTLVSTMAAGACRTTIRGELVPDDNSRQLFRVEPQKLLFFWLDEVVEENGNLVEKTFQSFSFSNTKMTFPIPFALNVDSSKDCPRELRLNVLGSNHAGFHYEYPMRGWKAVRLETPEFQRVFVIPPTF